MPEDNSHPKAIRTALDRMARAVKIGDRIAAAKAADAMIATIQSYRSESIAPIRQPAASLSGLQAESDVGVITASAPSVRVVAPPELPVEFDRAAHPRDKSIVTLTMAGRPTKHLTTGDTVAFVMMHEADKTYGEYVVFGATADLILTALALDADTRFVVVSIRPPAKSGQRPRAIAELT